MNYSLLLSSRLRPKVVFLSSLFLVLTLLASPVMAQTPASIGRSTIHGRGIYEDTGRPVRGARVLLYADEGRGRVRTGVTDGNGEFTFKNIPADHYLVLLDYPGIINGFPMIDLMKREATDVIVDGSSTTEITVRTERGGVITGKVTYPDGEPVIGAQMNVFVKNGNRYSHAPLVSAGAETDDRGIYRIYPLPPGEYIVSVIEQSLLVEERDTGTMQTTGNRSLNPYYYPDASSSKNAALIKVDAGREVNDINISLTGRPTYKAAGLITSGGKPLVDVYLRISPQDHLPGPTLMRPWGPSARADREGQWSFRDVPNGVYDIELDYAGERPVARSSPESIHKSIRRFVVQRQQVTVAGADVLNVAMALSEGGQISGTVRVEGDKPLPEYIGVSTELLADDKPEGSSAGSHVDMESKGAFLIEGVPAGDNLLSVRLMGRKYYVKSITWNGVDLLRHPLQVEAGGETNEVQILLSDEAGTLTGQLLSGQSKKALVQSVFMLVPSDESRWSRKDAYIEERTDKKGGFSVSGPPGEYLLILPPPGGPWFVRADWIKKHAATAPRVMLKPSGQSSVEIVVPNL